MTPHNDKEVMLSDAHKEKLVKEFFDTILLLIDERSMISLNTLGKAETSIAQSTRGEKFGNNSWGDLPVVVLIGDDMQLPSVMKGSLFLPVGPMKDRSKGPMTALEKKGSSAFLEAGNDVMVLGTVKRQDDSEKKFKEILEEIRNDCLDEENYEYLSKFHLQGDLYTPHQINQIEKDAMFLFTRNILVVNKNLEMLDATSGIQNPVARIVCDYPRTKHQSGKGIKNHFSDDLPTVCLICVGAKVALSNKNFNPIWGLFNGARGTVISIAYARGKSPNNGDMPEYVIVDFPHYSGPAFWADHPTVSYMPRISNRMKIYFYFIPAYVNAFLCQVVQARMGGGFNLCCFVLAPIEGAFYRREDRYFSIRLLTILQIFYINSFFFFSFICQFSG